MKPPLPIVEGVGPSRRRLPAGRWQTVLEFLTEQYANVGAAVWLSRMERGLVVDETGLRLTPSSPYRVGACIFYYREPETEPAIPFAERIIYRDEHILVADKPHFLPVAPTGRFLVETLLVRLRKKEGLADLTPIHRIDRETAGLVVFSINAATRGRYVSLFRERRVRKIYEALAPRLADGRLASSRRSRIVTGEPFFTMKEIEGEPNSETHIEIIAQRDDASLYRLIPVTGKKHQLRLHLSALGAPILNDRLYPEVIPVAYEDYSAPLKLLAGSISFTDPLTGREHRFESDRRL